MEGNAGKRETLISNLEFDFDIIAVSETWTSYSRENIKPKTIDGYQTYHGTKGHTLKSGCGFYVKNCLKFQQQTDLDLSVIDENNEFQSCWIEIINNLILIFQASQLSQFHHVSHGFTAFLHCFTIDS